MASNDNKTTAALADAHSWFLLHENPWCILWKWKRNVSSSSSPQEVEGDHPPVSCDSPFLYIEFQKEEYIVRVQWIHEISHDLLNTALSELDGNKNAHVYVYLVQFRKHHQTSKTEQQQRPNQYDDSNAVLVPVINSQAHDDSTTTTDIGTKLLLHNHVVKVWEFILIPGQTSHMHQHVHPYMFINLVPSTSQGIYDTSISKRVDSPVTSQCADQVTFVDLKLGQVAVHANRNCGDSRFCQVIVEFLRSE